MYDAFTYLPSHLLVVLVRVQLIIKRTNLCPTKTKGDGKEAVVKN